MIAHGEYSIVIEENILILGARGPFNDEIVLEYTAELKKSMHAMQWPWGQINI